MGDFLKPIPLQIWISLEMLSCIILLALALHNLVANIIREKRYKGSSILLVIFYVLAITYISANICYLGIVLWKSDIKASTKNAFYLGQTTLIILIGANYALEMN
jgi:archaellum biogenesis protein FlaJ (TadC family)